VTLQVLTDILSVNPEDILHDSHSQ